MARQESTTPIFSSQKPAKKPLKVHAVTGPALTLQETPQQAAERSAGCQSCHTGIEHPNMHAEDTVVLGCTDCHGGNAHMEKAGDQDSPEYAAAKKAAHVPSRFEEDLDRGGHPERAYTRWLKESYEFVKFANPGDLRVANETCGGCHAEETRKVKNSMMTHGAMLWGAALYNNGGYPLKNPHFGEAYDVDGKPVRLRTFPPPSPEETRTKGVLPFLDPLQRWEYSQPGNMLRAFERGGEEKAEIGNPSPLERSGKPDTKLSNRGLGTDLRTDPVFLGLQKTRLLDPLLSLPGTNDNPGDFRSSGCSGCHVLYANDRDPVHSGAIAQFGNQGRSQSQDPTVPKAENGHPLEHAFTKAIPSSQCMVCHVHPGTNMVTSYYGFTWWDNEVDGKKMYPAEQHDPRPRRAERDQPPQPRRRRRPRQLVQTSLPAAGRHAGVQQRQQRHPVRGLPLPRLDFPQGLQTRPRRQPARHQRQKAPHQRSHRRGNPRQGRPPHGHSPRKGNALRRLPLHPG